MIALMLKSDYGRIEKGLGRIIASLRLKLKSDYGRIENKISAILCFTLIMVKIRLW